MRITPYIFVFIFSCLFTACHNNPTGDAQQDVTDTTEGVLAQWNSVENPQPIENSRVDYFSNIVTQDSFSVELPQGEVLNGNFYFRIYNDGKLLYSDTIPNQIYLDTMSLYKVQHGAEDFLYAMENGMDGFLSESNFSQAADNQDLQSASPDEIQNMQAFDELHEHPRSIIFTYPKSANTYALISYSKKQKRIVLVALRSRPQSI